MKTHLLMNERTACGLVALGRRAVISPTGVTCSKCKAIHVRDLRAAQEPITEVLFRRFPKKEGGDVIALFPLVPGITTDPMGTCESYQHVGQHGAAGLRLTLYTKPAREGEPDVDALKRELESLGYRLRVLKRLPHWTRIRDSRKAAGL